MLGERFLSDEGERVTCDRERVYREERTVENTRKTTIVVSFQPTIDFTRDANVRYCLRR